MKANYIKLFLLLLCGLFADQIASRHYADAYAASSKPVISLALEFDRQSRGLIDWKKL